MTQTTDTAATIAAADSPLSSWERGAGGERSFPRYPAYRESGVPWLGAVPAHWAGKRLKFCLSSNDSGVWGDDPDDGEGTIVLRSTDMRVDGAWELTDSARRNLTDAEVRAATLKTGDLVITKSSGSPLHLGKTALVTKEIEALSCCHSNFMQRLRPKGTLDSSYIFRIMNSPIGREQLNLFGSTTTGLANLSGQVIGDMQIPLPPLAEQRAIAAFLDRETARIDALVAAKRRLIELLREKRAALISRAVTRGLDADVPLRESGVPAVGNVPANWLIERNKTIFREAGERSVEGQEELLTVSHITGVTRRSQKDVTMIMAESFEGYKLCRPGDLAVNTMWAWMGAVGIVRELGIVSPSYNVYRLRPEAADVYDPEYLDLLYRTPAYVCEINRYSQGIWDSRLRLYPEAFFSMQTLTPPVHEQHQIVEHCRSEIARLDAFSQKLSESIERLREYRTALIAAAVTGAIDVRESARADTSSGPVQEVRHG